MQLLRNPSAAMQVVLVPFGEQALPWTVEQEGVASAGRLPAAAIDSARTITSPASCRDLFIGASREKV
jgi:hypothetical protein